MLRKFIAGPLIVMLVLSTTAFGQERHAVPSSTIAHTVASEVAQQDADRAAIRRALARPEVQEIAAKAGFDLARAQAGIDTLSAESLSKAAAAAQQVNETLVGGASTVTISTTTIIIILLVVILIMVAD